MTVEMIAFIQSSIGENKVCGIKQCFDRTVEMIAFIQFKISEDKVCGKIQCADSRKYCFIQPIISKDKKKVCGIKQCADWTAERISFMRSSMDEQCAESDRRLDRICYSVK